MSTHHEANDRAMRRCEEAYLREPEPPACDACGGPTRDGNAYCDDCYPLDDEPTDDLVSVDGSEGE